uniref:Uncharacterized protein n=1 Tax=Candidatus Kentrum sp. FM TaxID=2126340 RepID=A0A450SWE7_9GAMM|nr:MAG: hypothetical protein BECKFM1743C_GA0114222_102214 [Candidatus Kentron sp. FM]
MSADGFRSMKGHKAIGRKEYTKLRRIFVQIQGARQAHEPCNCRATHKLDDKDKQVGIFFDRNRLSPTLPKPYHRFLFLARTRTNHTLVHTHAPVIAS